MLNIALKAATALWGGALRPPSGVEAKPAKGRHKAGTLLEMRCWIFDPVRKITFIESTSVCLNGTVQTHIPPKSWCRDV
jgi:hypothetical protein